MKRGESLVQVALNVFNDDNGVVDDDDLVLSGGSVVFLNRLCRQLILRFYVSLTTKNKKKSIYHVMFLLSKPFMVVMVNSFFQ
jgi:hypothetical protein